MMCRECDRTVGRSGARGLCARCYQRHRTAGDFGNEPRSRFAGWPISVSYRQAGVQRRGWLRYDPARGRCECGAESEPLESGEAVKAWLVAHEHEVVSRE